MTGSIGTADCGVDLSELAEAFDLPPLHVVEHRTGASGVWRLRTAHGDDLAFSSRSATSPQVAAEISVASELERRAAAAGLDLVPYLLPKHPFVGLAARIRDRLVILHEWVDTIPDIPDDVPPAWLGGTVATLHSLWPVPNQRVQKQLARAYGIHPTSSWQRWIDDADQAGLAWASDVAASLPVIEEATRLSQSALDLDLPVVQSHRDLNPPNLLHTPTGYRLCDFGYAGPDIAWLEIVDAALACTTEPAATIEHYLAAGGKPGPRQVEALARTTSPMWLARTIAVSLGFTTARTPAREAASAAIPEILLHLRHDVDTLDTTAAAVFNLG